MIKNVSIEQITAEMLPKHTLSPSAVGRMTAESPDALGPCRLSSAQPNALEVEKSRPELRTQIAKCLVGLALLAGVGDQYRAPTEASARTRLNIPKAPFDARQPILPPVRKAKCGPNTKILFTLRGSRTVTPRKPEKFLLSAKSCPGKSSNTLKQVKIVSHNAQGQATTWKIKKLPVGEKRRRTIKLSFPDVAPGKISTTESIMPKVVVRASNQDGKQLGSSQWRLKKNSAFRKSTHPIPVGEDEPCTPIPDFRLGIQDDAAFVWEKYGPRKEAFRLAREAFPDVNILRINLLYDDVKNYGYQAYIDTVIEAKKYDFSVYATLMPTPAYRPKGDQTLSYANEDPEAMRLFAKETAAALGPDVAFYEIGNEPQHPLFSAFLDLDHYKKMALAGLDGVRTSNQNAKVIFGGLAPNEPSSIVKWLSGLQGLSNGVSLHPYGVLINEVREYTEAAGSAKGRLLYLSEYGNDRGPSQMSFNKIAADRARCAGAAALIYYLLYDDLSNLSNWHTGIYPVNTSVSTPTGP